MKKIFNHTFRLNFAALAGYNSKYNLKCMNCHKDYFEVSKPFNYYHALDFVSAIKLFKTALNSPRHLYNKIIITGHAEPLIIGKDRFLNEVKLLQKNFPDLSISITTNGSYLKSVINEFLSLHNTFINLSLHHIAYLKTKWFNDIADYSIKYPGRIDLNVTIDNDSVTNLQNILHFVISKNMSVKFFHRLESTDPDGEINNLIDRI